MQKWPKCKNEHHYGVLATFSDLRGSGWMLLELSWGILARSWAILGDLGAKLGPSWQHVGAKMAKSSEDEAKMTQRRPFAAGKCWSRCRAGVVPEGCAARRGGFRRGNRELQYRNSRQSTNESDTQLGTYGPGADLIAPRRPPGQDMLALGFVVEHRRCKKQCKETSEELGKQC